MSIQVFRSVIVGAFLFLLLPFFRFVDHTSQDPEVLGRYSTGYFGMLVGYAGLLTVASALLILALRSTLTWASRITAAAIWLRRRRWLLILLLVLPPLAMVAVVDRLQEYAPGRSAIFQFSLLALYLMLAGMMLLVGRVGRERKEAMLGITLFVLSATLTLGFMEITLRRFPSLIPDVARAHLPGEGMFLRSDLIFDKPIRIGYRYQPLQDRWVEYSASSGDLYRRMAGAIEPLIPDKDEVLARIHFVTDENGYPNQPPLRDQYDVVVTGDSFTVPGVVADPWPILLERITGQSVLNLAIPGYSIAPEVEAVAQFGLAKRPSWVIVAYFEGNDLTIEAPGFEAKRVSGLSWIEYDLQQAGPYQASVALQTLRYGLAELFQQSWLKAEAAIAYDAMNESPASYRYPVTVRIADEEMRLAFYDPYLSALTASREDIERSGNFALVTKALLDLKQEAEAAGAQLLIVYIPSKAHIYLPLIHDEKIWSRVLNEVPAVTIWPDGYLSSSQAHPATIKLVKSKMDDQRDAIETFAWEQEIHFLDLTPDFQTQAALGEELYYLVDTHWNQRGHRLAAQTIAEYIKEADFSSGSN